ncbi:MAG TPA: glycoside hydrolase family 6 protein [Nonomuraea sp.]|nr:glycoside hydrolase family 6 protein [Nonomuraea sp.]
MTLEALRGGDPRQVGPYTLVGRLGEGGMGVVYLGQGADGTPVAVKIIHARMDTDPGFRRRFAREVAAARRVARFCTAPVLDADVEGEPAYLVTEYVEGPNLHEVVRSSGPLTGSALDGLAASMAMALRAIHGAGVVHRDLKPSNVLLSQVGPKVIDFGIARLAGSEMSSAIVGTPSYMSPEQVSGSAVGPASDVFSWGCTVGFAAGGVPPFGSGSVPTIMLRVVNDPPDLRGLSGPLRELVVASLAKNPAERPTAQELMDRLSGSPAATDVDVDMNVVAAPASRTGTGPEIGASADGGRAGKGERGESGGGESGRGESGGGKVVVAVTAAAAAAVVVAAGVSAALVWRDQATPARPAGGATAEAGAPSSAAAGRNPLRTGANVAFYAPPEPGAGRQAERWAADRPEDAELMRKLAAVPHAIRLNQPDARAEVERTISAAGRAGGVPVFLVNSMPGSDCRPYDAGDLAAYQGWLRGIAGQIGGAAAVVVLEPSSLVNVPGSGDCDVPGSAAQRYADLRQAVRTLKTGPNTAVYLDGGQDVWPGAAIMAERLVGAGIDRADGFFVNTAGHHSTDKSVAYGKRLSACVSVRLAGGGTGCPADVPADPDRMPHFVVDTARNGQGSWAPTRHYPDPQTWCNAPGRGVGARPTTDTGEDLVDAYLWIARAGSSSGRCRRGTGGEEDPERGVVSPEAGEWWGELALERAKLADPPLR